MGLNPSTEAVLLRDGSVGVSTENTPRSVQSNGENGRKVTLNPAYTDQLDLEPGAATLHSLSVGVKPVLVQHPAIIVQPASVLGENHD
jgi:hypothetical protein